MSRQAANDPETAIPGPCEPVELVVAPRARDIGGFAVHRALPSSRRQMVGPFIFFDQMGPALLGPGKGLDVRPHPHIGLATVTYVFEGEILHRDSLGTVQPIRPGEVNWMTAGSGIVHSERSDEAQRRTESPLFGIQVWVALPRRDEETAPSFAHHGSAELPTIEGEGTRVRLIAGSLYGARSPVKTFSEMFYADAVLSAGASLPLAAGHEERAVYIAGGRIEIAGETFEPAQLLILRPGDEITVRAPEAARLLLLGGEPMDGPRHIWWNFVSSSKERIREAGEDWRAGRFDPVPGETEFIPLPDGPPPPVRYP